MKTFAIIPIAGKGVRFGSDLPKQFIEVYGKPLFIYTLEKFQNNCNVDYILIACSKDNMPIVKDIINKYNLTKVYKLVQGGDTQLESIINCIKSVDIELSIEDKIIVHVGNRPNLSDTLISRCIKKYDDIGPLSTVVPCIEVMINTDNNAIIPRDKVVRIQTPQVYSFGDLKKVIYDENLSNMHASTLCDLLISNNYKVSFIDGELTNFKITYKEDLDIFKAIISSRENKIEKGEKNEAKAVL